MAVVVDGGSDGRSGDRRPVTGRLASSLGPKVRRYVDVSSPDDGKGRQDDAERLLRAAVDALLDLAHRNPGIDLTIQVGPAGGPTVRLHYTNKGLVTDRLNTRGRSTSREAVGPALSESEVVSELASLLWSGEVDSK